MSISVGKLKEFLAVIPDHIEVWIPCLTIGQYKEVPILRTDFGSMPTSIENFKKYYLQINKDCQDAKRKRLENEIKIAQTTLNNSTKELEELLQEDDNVT